MAGIVSTARVLLGHWELNFILFYFIEYNTLNTLLSAFLNLYIFIFIPWLFSFCFNQGQPFHC